MSHSQFHSIDLFILRHAWLNLWDKRMLLAESTRLLSRGHRSPQHYTAASNKEIRSSGRLRNTLVGTFHSISQRIAFLFRKRAHDALHTDKLSLAESFINPKVRRRYHARSSGGYFSSTYSNRNQLVVSLAVGNLSSLTARKLEIFLAWPSYSSVISTPDAAGTSN